MSPEVQKLIDNLNSYGLGKTIEDFASKQPLVVDAVHSTGLQGKVVLTISYKRSGQSGILVNANVKATIPQRPVQAVDMFMDENNDLHEENPEQMLTSDKDVIKPDFQKKVNQV